MKKFLPLITLFALVLAANPVHADWVLMGVAEKCESERQIFTLYPTVTTSDDKFNIKAPSGSQELEQGKDQSYRCKLEETQIDMIVSVYGPQERGMGQGAGVIIISRLLVGNHELIDRPTDFNWQVMDERVLTKVTVEKRFDGFVSELCYSDGWGWEAPYAKPSCERRNIGS